MFALRPSWALAVVALLVPVLTSAQSVPAVSGIEARVVGEQVSVVWDPLPATSDIAYYHVYFSSQSILANSGQYDDFEQTEGPVSNHTIRTRLSSRVVYVSVLAVDNSGNVGSVFLEEDSVVLQKDDEIAVSLQEGDFKIEKREEPTTQTFNLVGAGEKRTTREEQERAAVQNVIPTREIPQWQRADLGGRLHLLLTDAISPTEIQLTFSDFPYVDPAFAQQSFSVKDAAGTSLRLTGIVIDQEIITIGTVRQVRGKVYEVVLREPIQGLDGSPLDPEHRKAFFQGHIDGGDRDAEVSTQAATSAAQLVCTPQEMATPSPIQNLQLTSQPDFYGAFVINARWQLQNPCNSLTGYVVRQSRDGGKTFNEPTVMPLNVGGLDIPGAVPGRYTFGISVMNIYGSTSKESIETIGIAGPDGKVPGAPEPIAVEKKVEPRPVRKTVAVKVSTPMKVIKAPKTMTDKKVPEKKTGVKETVRKTVVSKLAQTGGGAVAALVTLVGGLGGAIVSRKRRQKL